MGENSRLLFHKYYSALLKKTGVKNNKKNYQTWLNKNYNNEPLVTFIIQSHNKSLEVKYITSKLREFPESEIIVIDDGSTEKHINIISKHLKNANEFVIRSNDLYENVMYDKAIRFANGKYIVLLQDDDDFENLLWVDEAIIYFLKYPNLAIIGGNEGLDFKVFGIDNAHDIQYENTIKQPFAFVHTINRAPMWINKLLFEEKLKHIDFNFAPFQYDDCELCLRAWLNGLQVGWYDAEFKSLSAGGMRIWNSQFTDEQCLRNQKKLYDLYKDQKEVVDNLVINANNI